MLDVQQQPAACRCKITGDIAKNFKRVYSFIIVIVNLWLIKKVVQSLANYHVSKTFQVLSLSS